VFVSQDQTVVERINLFWKLLQCMKWTWLVYCNILWCVITADCDSPVHYDKSLPSYSDADSDDLEFVPLTVKNSADSVTPSVLHHGDWHHSVLAAESHTDTVCAPILVVPSSNSYISMIRTPDSSPDRRPPMFSPSQARWFSFSVMICNVILLTAWWCLLYHSVI